MPSHAVSKADTVHTTENRQRMSGGLRCAGQSDPLCKAAAQKHAGRLNGRQQFKCNRINTQHGSDERVGQLVQYDQMNYNAPKMQKLASHSLQYHNRP